MKRVEFVKTKEAAERLSVSISTICDMLKDGRLKGRKIGREGITSSWRISKKSLEDYIAQGI